MSLKQLSCAGVFLLACMTGTLVIANQCTVANPADAMAAYLMVATNCPELADPVPPVTPVAKTNTTSLPAGVQYRLVTSGSPGSAMPDMHNNQLVTFFWLGR